MLTDEQKRDLDKLRRRVERERLTSCMNDTKWDAAISAVRSVPGYRATFRVRMVTESEGDLRHGMYWSGDFPGHVPTLQFIEWLELDPLVRTRRGALVEDATEDFTRPLMVALLQARIPFSLENGMIRVWGYTRPGESPDFVRAVS